MSLPLGLRLECAVRALCPDICRRVNSPPSITWGEKDLLTELFCCVLSSQVPYVSAQAASMAIREAGLLDSDLWFGPSRHFENAVSFVLSQPLPHGKLRRRYRFPRVRAEQISSTREQLVAIGTSLKGLLKNFSDEFDARRKLVGLVKGMGPKQSSMFLRNIGQSYNLAILDRHVLKYMQILGLAPDGSYNVLDLRRYEQIEGILRDYSSSLGYPVGYVDWAMWIVMHVAQKEQYV